MKVKYVHKPQDESADAKVWVALSPSYITYNPATIQRVQDYFKSEEVGCWHPFKGLCSQPNVSSKLSVSCCQGCKIAAHLT